MMEWVLRDCHCADPYIDDLIIGSTSDTPEGVLKNHERDVRKVLDTLAENQLLVDPAKAHFFVQEVEFCGHILKEGRRQPFPSKLLSIQK